MKAQPILKAQVVTSAKDCFSDFRTTCCWALVVWPFLLAVVDLDVVDVVPRASRQTTMSLVTSGSKD